MGDSEVAGSRVWLGVRLKCVITKPIHCLILVQYKRGRKGCSVPSLALLSSSVCCGLLPLCDGRLLSHPCIAAADCSLKPYRV